MELDRAIDHRAQAAAFRSTALRGRNYLQSAAKSKVIENSAAVSARHRRNRGQTAILAPGNDHALATNGAGTMNREPAVLKPLLSEVKSSFQEGSPSSYLPLSFAST